MNRCEVAVEIQNRPRLTEVFIRRCDKPGKLYTDRMQPFGIFLCDEHREWRK